MKWTQLQAKWDQFRGKVLEEWGKLTNDDLGVIHGDIRQLHGKLQERYGYDRARSERAVDQFLSRISRPSGGELESFSEDPGQSADAVRASRQIEGRRG